MITVRNIYTYLLLLVLSPIFDSELSYYLLITKKNYLVDKILESESSSDDSSISDSNLYQSTHQADPIQINSDKNERKIRHIQTDSALVVSGSDKIDSHNGTPHKNNSKHSQYSDDNNISDHHAHAFMSTYNNLPSKLNSNQLNQSNSSDKKEKHKKPWYSVSAFLCYLFLNLIVIFRLKKKFVQELTESKLVMVKI